MIFRVTVRVFGTAGSGASLVGFTRPQPIRSPCRFSKDKVGRVGH
jgi:hypothetical protein